MGYTTEFTGSFSLNKRLDDFMFNYLTKFNETRRMKRNMDGKFGVEGEYYVDAEGFAGQNKNDDTIVDYNKPPSTQPGLWCQWRPSLNRMGIEWDEGEKFYNYVEWLQYIVSNFLAPCGYVLNGTVYWVGEDRSDVGAIIVRDNRILVSEGKVEYQSPIEINEEKSITIPTFILDAYADPYLLENK